MAVTLKQIADKVGVDVSVVSRVLNNKIANYKFSEKRMEQIRNAARELGYIPNISARAIKFGSFGCVALLLSSHGERSYLPNLLLDSMHQELEKRGKHLLLAKLPDVNESDISRIPSVLKTLMADGLIIDYTHHVSSEVVDRIEKFILPKVWINTKRAVDCIYPDNYGAGAYAAKKLISLGHKKIAYVTDVSYEPTKLGEHYSILDRYSGYLSEMKRAGLKTYKIAGGGKVIPKDKQVEYFINILSSKNRPTAMILYWSSLVPAILIAARKLQIKIPSELSIITFAGCSSYDSGLSINAMIEPEEEMGIESVKMLNKKIKNSNKSIKSISLNFSYFDVGTCKRF